MHKQLPAKQKPLFIKNRAEQKEETHIKNVNNMAKIKVKSSSLSGDPSKPTETMILSANKPKIDVDFDIRDRLAELVGKGNALSPDDKAAIYGNLAATLGEGRARKIMTHAYIFNQRGDVQNLPLEDKLRSFYAIGSSDPEVQGVIQKSKTLGYGVVPGFREGSSSINQELTGRVAPTATATASPDVQQRIRVRLNK
jgi:hypothetical protein